MCRARRQHISRGTRAAYTRTRNTQIGFEAQESPNLSQLGRVPQLDGTVVGAHAQKVPPVPAHPLHAARARTLPPNGPKVGRDAAAERVHTAKKSRARRARLISTSNRGGVSTHLEERVISVQTPSVLHMHVEQNKLCKATLSACCCGELVRRRHPTYFL